MSIIKILHDYNNAIENGNTNISVFPEALSPGERAFIDIIVEKIVVASSGAPPPTTIFPL